MQLMEMAADTLAEIKDVSLRLNYDISKNSSWSVGGTFPVAVFPKTKRSLVQVFSALAEIGQKYLVVGATTNLLFQDGLYECVLINLKDYKNISKITDAEESVECSSGVWMPSFARYMAGRGRGGFEHLCGVPGTVGGLVYMNGGSQRKSISEKIISVEVFDRKKSEVVIIEKKDLEFSYRSSVFQNSRDYYILSVKFDISERRCVKKIRREMLDILFQRRSKFPLKLPNCGSVFVSSPEAYEKVGPPGKVIEELGLKGLTLGGAQVSSIHANFIVNTGGARYHDVLTLIDLIRNFALVKTGFELKPEVRSVSLLGEVSSI